MKIPGLVRKAAPQEDVKADLSTSKQTLIDIYNVPQNELPADMVTSPTQSGEWLTGNGHNEPRPCPLLAPASGNATCRVLEQGSITA